MSIRTDNAALPAILDLGCGCNKQPGAWGVDIVSGLGDQQFNLEDTPWALPSDHFALVYALQVLEHLSDSVRTMQEIYRICRHGALMVGPVLAQPFDDGSYICVHEPLNVGHLFAYLRGETTLGTYLLNQESQAPFLVLDADDAQGWGRLGNLARVLARQPIPAYLEKSRRGGHLWLFLAEVVSGREVRAFGHGLLAAHEIEGVELFPKQDELAGGTVLEEDGVPRAPAAGVDLIQQLLPVPLFHELPPPV